VKLSEMIYQENSNRAIRLIYVISPVACKNFIMFMYGVAITIIFLFKSHDINQQTTNLDRITMSTRSVITRTRGRGHGTIARMFSPGDLGRTLKPFVFLDFLSGDVKKDGLNFGYHPHSGIGTLTYAINAAVDYTDTEGRDGTLHAGGLEWMKAGGGAWHKSTFHSAVTGLLAFQFWFALPPKMEDGPSESLYVDPRDVPKRDNFKLLIGDYDGLKSPIPAPMNVAVIDVVLNKNDETFTYKVPTGHKTSFVMVYTGSALVCDDERISTTNEVFVLDEFGETIQVKRVDETNVTSVLIASAVPHPYSLSLGMYSVHTNPESLAQAEMRIDRIGEELSRQGKLK
jgi:redox-sensitive bicupin YhaK (pirin superfamily)